MTCAAARDALLTADLPLAFGASSELALHLRDCARCASLARVLTGDIETLRSSLWRRTIKRRRVAGIAMTSVAAAVVVLFAMRSHSPASTPIVTASQAEPAVNAHPTDVVSVQVAPGKQATVFKTSDPTVTVVWLTDGGGL